MGRRSKTVGKATARGIVTGAGRTVTDLGAKLYEAEVREAAERGEEFRPPNRSERRAAAAQKRRVKEVSNGKA
jgi:hypothetical protein